MGAKNVKVTAKASSTSVVILVADDGPGLSVDEAQAVMQRGRRLDESAPGHGFGLPITEKLAELYGGSLSIGPSPNVGLTATLTLPMKV